MNTASANSQRGSLLKAVILALALGGGSTPAITFASNALKDVEQIKFAEIAIDANQIVDVNHRSQFFDFHSGASHLVAYALPESDKPLLIDVVSFMNSDRADLSSTVFYPLVAVLDRDLLVRRTTSLNDLRFDLPFLQRTTHPAYRVSLRVEPHSEEKYIVIYTSGNLLHNKNPMTRESLNNPTELDSIFGYGASDHGKLQIAIETLGP